MKSILSEAELAEFINNSEKLSPESSRPLERNLGTRKALCRWIDGNVTGDYRPLVEEDNAQYGEKTYWQTVDDYAVAILSGRYNHIDDFIQETEDLYESRREIAETAAETRKKAIEEILCRPDCDFGSMEGLLQSDFGVSLFTPESCAEFIQNHEMSMLHDSSYFRNRSAYESMNIMESELSELISSGKAVVWDESWNRAQIHDSVWNGYKPDLSNVPKIFGSGKDLLLFARKHPGEFAGTGIPDRRTAEIVIRWQNSAGWQVGEKGGKLWMFDENTDFSSGPESFDGEASFDGICRTASDFMHTVVEFNGTSSSSPVWQPGDRFLCACELGYVDSFLHFETKNALNWNVEEKRSGDGINFYSASAALPYMKGKSLLSHGWDFLFDSTGRLVSATEHDSRAAPVVYANDDRSYIKNTYAVCLYAAAGAVAEFRAREKHGRNVSAKRVLDFSEGRSDKHSGHEK